MILLAAVPHVFVAGAPGGPVASKPKPFGFDDPRSESVIACHTIERITGADPDNSLIAGVSEASH